MTRARTLKTLIRTRAAKTGERYTTARRHVLQAIATRTATRPPTRPAAAAVPPPTGAPTRGGLSEAKSVEKTGHGLAHWFAVLDEFGAVRKGHTAAARHLANDHGVDGWYAQGITVAFERARGLRAVNQRTSGSYEGSVTKVVGVSSLAIVAAFDRARQRSRWLAGANGDGAARLREAFGTGGTTFRVREDGMARCRFADGDAKVELSIWPKGADKASTVFTVSKLPSQAALDAHKAQWRVVLDALAAGMKSATPARKRA
jgi:hypothetical protein